VNWSPNTTYVQQIASGLRTMNKNQFDNVFFDTSDAAIANRNFNNGKVLCTVDFTTNVNYTLRMDSKYLPQVFSSQGITVLSASSSLYMQSLVPLQDSINELILVMAGGSNTTVSYETGKLASRGSNTGIFAQLMSSTFPNFIVLAFM
jgi:hypothetical protein